MLTLKIGKMPGKIEEFVFGGPVKVSEALATAGISAEGCSVKFGGSTVGLDDTISTDGLLLVVPNIKGA